MKASDILLSLEFAYLEVSKDVGGRVMVDYRNCEVKEGCFLRSSPGRGQNFEEACEDYLNQIRGKTLVFNTYSDSRKEIKVLG